MQVSKEEILHIANLANLTLEENEIENYLENLQEILDFADIVNNAHAENLDITIGANEYTKYNVVPSDTTCTDQRTNGKKEITLITCTNDSKERVIVKARAI